MPQPQLNSQELSMLASLAVTTKQSEHDALAEALRRYTEDVDDETIALQRAMESDEKTFTTEEVLRILSARNDNQQS